MSKKTTFSEGDIADVYRDIEGLAQKYAAKFNMCENDALNVIAVAIGAAYGATGHDIYYIDLFYKNLRSNYEKGYKHWKVNNEEDKL